MAVGYNPRAVTDGLVLSLDAGNPKNYNAGISTNWTDKIGGNNGTLVGGTHHTDGPFVGAGYVEFDGTGDSLTLSNTADHQFGSSDYTIEAWVYLNNLSTVQALFGRYNTSINAREIYITLNTDGSITHRTSSNGTSFSTHLTSAGLLTANTWHHVAISKSGTTSYIAVDGVVVTGTVDSTLHTASQITYIGDLLSGSNFLNGNLSNYRILKGTALYTSNFTPPTEPLTAVTNTVLLTCQGNTISPGTDIVVTTSNKGSGSVGSLSAVTSSGNYRFDNRSASPSTASIQLDFKTVQIGVTQIKLSGGSYALGSTFDLYVNGVLVEDDRSVVSAWGEDTITISSTDISSIKIEGSDGYSLGALKFNGTLVSGTISEIVPNGDISLTKEPFGGAGAVSFDGSGDYLECSNTVWSDLDGVNTSFTIEAWIYPTNVSSQSGEIIGINNSGSTSSVSFRILPTYALVFGNWGSGYTSAISSSNAVTQNAWNHVVASKDGSTLRLFVNGNQVASVTVTNGTLPTFSRNTQIGGRSEDNLTKFIGYISNLRVVKGTALYTSNFTPPAEPLTAVPNTVLLTCQGQNIKDASSNAHAITVNGDAKATIVSSSFEFDGTDDEVSISSYQLSTTNSSAPYTLSAWINRTGSTTDGGIITQYVTGSSAVDRFGLREQNSKLSWWKGGSDLAISTNNIPTNVWKYIVGVKRSDNSVSIYIDGIEVGTGTDNLDFENATLKIGRFGTIAPFSGNISQVSIYNRALTAAEVTQNYNATKGRYA